MPLYEFECGKCGHIFEELCSSDEMAICPVCASGETRKRISAPAPLKKGAFPFKPGPVHPIARSPNRPRSCGICKSEGNCGNNKD